MLFSLFIYITLIAVMSHSFALYPKAYKNKDIKLSHPVILIPILLYTFIMGCRYGVGKDYFNYLELYEDVKYFEPNWTEFLFSSYTYVLSINKVHFSFFFGIIAFIQIVFFVKAYKKFPKILPLAIIFYFVGSYYLGWNNVLRQNLVVAIFLNMIPLIEKRKMGLYYLGAFLCIGIHLSSILLFLIYPTLVFIEKHYKNNNIKLMLTVYLAFVGMGLFVDIFSYLFNNEFLLLFLLDTDYSSYAMNEGLMTAQTGSALGLGYLLKVTNRILIILFSTRLLMYYKSTFVKYAFWLCYIGFCLHALFTTSIVLQRTNLYFISIELIIVPFLWYYWLHKKTKYNKLNLLLFCFSFTSYFLMFMTEIMKGKETTAEFHFFF